MEIFRLQDASEEVVFVSGNIPGNMGDKAFVNSIEVSDFKSSILLRLANVFPRAESNRIGRIIILNTGPPESTNDSVDFLHEDL